MTTIDPTWGTLVTETTLPAFAEVSIDGDGRRSLSLRIDLDELGGDHWRYDEVIAEADGMLTILFDEETA
jgi:hypothetical protein